MKVRRGVSELRLPGADAGISPTGSIGGFLASRGVAWIGPTIDPPAGNAGLASSIGLDRYYTLRLSKPGDTDLLAREVAEKFPNIVENAEPEGIGRSHYVPPNDPGFGSQWHLLNVGQSVDSQACVSGADVNWLEAGDAAGQLSGVVVAVLDTGVSVSHPDLVGRLIQGRNTTTNNPSLVNNTDDSTQNSHGTKCAGVIAAMGNNGIGISGVAANAVIMPVKVQSGIFLNSGPVANGLTWATDNGARIASMSFGFPSGTTGLSVVRDAVVYAAAHGVLMVSSTGNTAGGVVGYPAAYPEVIAVGATNCRDQLAAFSTVGPEMDLVAPGESIYTTIDQSNNPDGYGFESGTSFSAPMVAATGALVLGINPSLTPEQVRAIIVGSTEDLGVAGYDASFGWGRLSAYNAVREALATLPLCPADVNANRLVDLGDLFLYFDLYFLYNGQASTPSFVDFNQDGEVNGGDLFAFMEAWFRGC
ncbi:MAG: S8 family serine peptidase [Phycisphaerales bacterium]